MSQPKSVVVTKAVVEHLPSSSPHFSSSPQLPSSSSHFSSPPLLCSHLSPSPPTHNHDDLHSISLSCEEEERREVRRGERKNSESAANWVQFGVEEEVEVPKPRFTRL